MSSFAAGSSWRPRASRIPWSSRALRMKHACRSSSRRSPALSCATRFRRMAIRAAQRAGSSSPRRGSTGPEQAWSRCSSASGSVRLRLPGEPSARSFRSPIRMAAQVAAQRPPADPSQRVQRLRAAQPPRSRDDRDRPPCLSGRLRGDHAAHRGEWALLLLGGVLRPGCSAATAAGSSSATPPEEKGWPRPPSPSSATAFCTTT